MSLVVSIMAQLPNLSRLSLTVTTAPTDAGMLYDEDDWYDNALADEEREPPRRRHKPGNSPPGKPSPPSSPPGGVTPTRTGPTIEPGTLFIDVEWSEIVRRLKDAQEDKDKSFAFRVHAEEFGGGRVWEMKMRLERGPCIDGNSSCISLIIEPMSAPTFGKRCVHVVLEDDRRFINSSPSVFEIESLFYDVPEGDYTALCRKEMLRPEDWSDPNAHTGQGAVVLQLLDTLAPLLDTHRLKLIDGSRFAPDSSRGNPDVISSNMFLTRALALLRGYGYYEARGWFSPYLMQAALSGNSYYRPELSNPQRMIDHAYADLLWTEVVMDTPTKHLYQAIVDFPDTLAARWNDWSPYSLEDGLSEQFRKYVYSKEACKRYADVANYAYIIEMLDWCKSDETDNGIVRDRMSGRWMDEFDELSIRQIRKVTLAMVAEMEAAYFMRSRYDDVPQEQERVVEFIDTFMKKVWIRWIEEPGEDSKMYPEEFLEKIIFNGDASAGTTLPPRSLKVVIDRETDSPKVVLVDNREDFTCEDMASVEERRQLQPFQPRRYRTPRSSA